MFIKQKIQKSHEHTIVLFLSNKLTWIAYI
jgi:hypothetical protein